MSQSILQNVKQQIDLLTWNERLDLIAYIAQKGTSDRPSLAVEKAIERIKDLDDPSQWITTIQEGDEINEQELEEWLRKRGYKV
ncbi:MAG: hypothetical protein DCF12_01610 [Snowella sp.]|jgi:hypothetical protein|nr:MAG: hypothetical protein DCF12_01610 [Snowella sp.]